jgi:hypothetical protein
LKIPDDRPIYPISAAQRVLRWSEMFSLEPRKVKENNIISSYLRVPADCDLDALEQAYNDLVRYNDALRLRIFRKGKETLQFIKEIEYMQLPRVPLDGEAAFKAYLATIQQYKITFFSENLVWARLLILGPGDGVLLMRMHHAVTDGYSVRLMFDQLETYYEARRRGEIPEPAQVYSVVKYFELQAAYAKSEQHQADRRYWFHLYTHQRCYSYPAGYRSEFGACDAEKMVIGLEEYTRLLQMARQTGCTLQSLMMTLVAVTTYVVTGRENFTLFSLTHGRLNKSLKNTVGCMMNTVPIFYDLQPDGPVQTQIRDNYSRFLEMLSHGRLPLGEQVPMSYPEAVKHFFNFNPAWLLFSCMEYGDLFAHARYQMDLIRSTNQPHQFYLSMLEIPGEQLDIDLSYQTRKYRPQTIKQLLQAYSAVIGSTLDHPDWTLRQIKQAYEEKKQ